MGSSAPWLCPSALRLLAVDLALPLESEQLGLVDAAHRVPLRQVLERASSGSGRSPKRLLQLLLVQVGVRAGVLQDGGHVGGVRRRRGVARSRAGAEDRRGAGLLRADRREAHGGGRETQRFEDPNRSRIQAAQELGILGNKTVLSQSGDEGLDNFTLN